MDAFARIKANVRAVEADGLGLEANEMHLDTAPLVVIKSTVTKAGEVEIRVEFFVDAFKQVQVECGRDALGVVIGGVEGVFVLLEIDADQQRAAGPELAGRIAEERYRLIRAKVADGRAGKENDFSA